MILKDGYLFHEINALENSVIALENANPNEFDTYVSRILTNGTNSNTTMAWAPNTGDTAWMLFSSALVLFMTMPGGSCIILCRDVTISIC